MKKRFLTLITATTFVSGAALAHQSSNNLVNACKSAAVLKLEKVAQAQDAVLLPETLQVDAIDNRLMNPYKYIWFSAQAELSNGALIQLKTLTQKPPFKGCF